MKLQQQALLSKATASLEAAQLLYEQGFQDFVISRAYDTMFYVAQAFLLGKGLSFSKHSAVISLFGQRFIKTQHLPLKFHRYLIDAQDSRLMDDYNIQSSFSNDDAKEIIRHAEEFLALGRKHRVDHL